VRLVSLYGILIGGKASEGKGRRRMAIGLLLEFSGAGQEHYDAVMEELNLGGRMPTGGIFHAAGPTEGGWRVVDVWESQEAFDAFFHEKLGQALQNAGLEPPQVQTWTVYNTLEPAQP
jgi:hypothetical protein